MFWDLSFTDKGTEEAEFRHLMAKRSRVPELRLHILGIMAWCFHATKAGSWTDLAASVMAGLTCALKLYELIQLPDLPHRWRYWLVMGCNLIQLLCGCRTFHAAFQAEPGAGPLLALFCVASGNGAIYLLAFTKLTPLPFTWQLPLLAAMAGVLLWHSADYCNNHLLQQGYGVIKVAACFLLPMIVPGAVDLLPPEGFMAAITAAAAAPGREGAREAALLCEHYQQGVLLACSAAIAVHSYFSESRRRKDFLAELQLRTARRHGGSGSPGSGSPGSGSPGSGSPGRGNPSRFNAGGAAMEQASSSNSNSSNINSSSTASASGSRALGVGLPL